MINTLEIIIDDSVFTCDKVIDAVAKLYNEQTNATKISFNNNFYI